MSALSKVGQTGSMSQLIKGSVAFSGIACACGKRTFARCHFADGGAHGACMDCASAMLVKFPDGSTASRLVCKRCQPLHRSEIWETALHDVLLERGS